MVVKLDEETVQRIQSLNSWECTEIYVKEVNEQIIKDICCCIEKRFGECRIKRKYGADGLILEFVRKKEIEKYPNEEDQTAGAVFVIETGGV